MNSRQRRRREAYLRSLGSDGTVPLTASDIEKAVRRGTHGSPLVQIIRAVLLVIIFVVAVIFAVDVWGDRAERIRSQERVDLFIQSLP